MFENISNREKKLLLAVGALVPIAIVFLCIFQLTSSFKANNEKLQSLDIQILDQEELELAGMLAGRRQTYYSNTSLHPSINIASNDYQDWLKTAMADSGLAWTGMTPAEGSKLRSENQTIGQSKIFKVSASGTLPQFNEFLSKFYQLDVLHRITVMTLIPQNEGRSTKPVRNGLLNAKMTFEALSLTSGKNHDGFENFRTNLANKEKDYQAILRRNIFGPANSEPVVSVSNKTWTTGKPYKTSISAKDANSNDLLTFELLESSIEKAALKQTKDTDRRAQFEMPDVEPGKYSFKIKVSDNGFPSKSTIEEFAVTVKAPRPPDPKPATTKKPDPEPEVDYIQLVKVTGIRLGKDGNWRVWVSVGHTGERLRLAVGETFDIGGKKYEVLSIDEDQDEATFAGDEKTFSARLDFRSRGALIETNL